MAAVARYLAPILTGRSRVKYIVAAVFWAV